MREILFRGKRTDNKEWIEGSYIKSVIKKSPFGYITPSYPTKPTQIYTVTLGEFTGLTDSNGKKIFEGDIIRYADMYDYNCYLESLDNIEAYDDVDFGNIWTIDEVVYGIKVGYPAFDLNKHDWEVNGLSNLNESCQYFYEVIGNIHDNPELLGGGNNAE